MLNQRHFIDALRFAASAAATNDIRYYLNGVLFEIRPHGLTMVGTDGHTMAVVDLVGEFAETADVIVSSVDVKLMLSAIKRDDVEGLNVDVVDGLVITDRTGRTWPLKGIEGKYPDFRRVVPSDKLEATAAIGLNAAYLATAATACAKIAGKKYQALKMEMHGASSSIKMIPDGHVYRDAFYIVMPTRL